MRYAGGEYVLLKWMRDNDAVPNLLGNEVRMIRFHFGLCFASDNFRMQLEELRGKRTLP